MAKLSAEQKVLFDQIWDEFLQIIADESIMNEDDWQRLLLNYSNSFNGEDVALEDDEKHSLQQLAALVEIDKIKNALDTLQRNQSSTLRAASHEPSAPPADRDSYANSSNVSHNAPPSYSASSATFTRSLSSSGGRSVSEKVKPSDMLKKSLGLAGEAKDIDLLSEAIKQGADLDEIFDKDLVANQQMFRTLAELDPDEGEHYKLHEALSKRFSNIVPSNIAKKDFELVRDLVGRAHVFIAEQNARKEKIAEGREAYYTKLSVGFQALIDGKEIDFLPTQMIEYIEHVKTNPLDNKHYQILRRQLEPGTKLYKFISAAPGFAQWQEGESKIFENESLFQLTNAVKDGDIGTISNLLGQPGMLDKINQPLFEDKTLLYIAAEYGQKEVVEQLILMGADPTARSKNGRNALHAAFMKENNSKTIEYLLSLDEFKEAMINATSDEQGLGSMTPLEMAVERGNIKNLRFLMQSKYVKQILLKSPEYVKKMIERALKSNIINVRLCASLLYSTAQSLGDQYVYAPSQLATSDFAQMQGENGYVLVKEIFKYGDKHLESITDMLVQGAPVNASAMYTPEGYTAFARTGMSKLEYGLIVAIQGRNLKCFNLLLNYGASPYIKGPRTGNTVLHEIILSEDRYDLMKSLLNYDPDFQLFNVKNFAGKTPLDLAITILSDRLKICELSNINNINSLNDIYQVMYLLIYKNMGTLEQVYEQVEKNLDDLPSVQKQARMIFLNGFEKRAEEGIKKLQLSIPAQPTSVPQQAASVAVTPSAPRDSQYSPAIASNSANVDLLPSEKLYNYILNININEDVEANFRLIEDLLAQDNAAANLTEAILEAVSVSQNVRLKKMFTTFQEAMTVEPTHAGMYPDIGQQYKQPYVQSVPNNNAASAATANPIKYQQPQHIPPTTLGANDMDRLAALAGMDPQASKSVAPALAPAPGATIDVTPVMPQANPPVQKVVRPSKPLPLENEPTMEELLRRLPQAPGITHNDKAGASDKGRVEDSDDESEDEEVAQKNKKKQPKKILPGS